VTDSIDRVSPTLRPNRRVVMRQIWETLLFLHWRVDPTAIQAMLPPGLTVDTFEGEAFVGLVPFTMRGVRPVWSPSIPWLSNFHETNVRTYVHHEGKDPGVWFFSLDAANPVAVQLARGLWKLPYHYARMDLRRDGEETSYRSERLWPGPVPATCDIRCRPTGTPRAAVVGTLEHFLAERYFLYSYSSGRLRRGQVHHAPYPLQTAALEHLEETFISANSLEPARAWGGQKEPLTHFASGVNVEVFGLTLVR
jgi:uncharacterized protein